MSLTVANIQALKRFKNLDEKDLTELKDAGRVLRFGKGKTIFHEGSTSDTHFTVINGHVKIFKNFEVPRILHIFGPGESFGELALINGIPFPASAVALGACSVLVIPGSVFGRLRQTSATFGNEVAKTLAKRPEFFTKAIANFTEGNLPERVKRAFADLLLRFGTDHGDYYELPFYLSRKEIASLINARPESVSRELIRWEQDNLLIPSDLGFRASKTFWKL
jgi:CRP/FNR family transcriptional regulator